MAQADNNFEEQEIQRQGYLSNFILDFMEFNLRKVALENSVKCARQVDYFAKFKKEMAEKPQEADLYQKKLDIEFENCLGKYTDSYEYAMEIFHNRMNLH